MTMTEVDKRIDWEFVDWAAQQRDKLQRARLLSDLKIAKVRQALAQAECESYKLDEEWAELALAESSRDPRTYQLPKKETNDHIQD
jgi:hypothetical protein